MRQKEIFEECPRYDFCSVNNCPLHPQFPNVHVDPGDSEQKCTVAKAIRIRIAAAHPGALQYEGMTKREYTARQTWENKSQEEKEAFKELGQPFRHIPGVGVGAIMES